MKNTLKFLSIFLILFTTSSCQKEKDWTCVCTNIWGEEEIIIFDKEKSEAIQECSNNNIYLLGIEATHCKLKE